jgi:DNA-binding transcriptional LysR family regulator
MPLDKDELAALVSVIKTGSYRAAAEELGRAQSSISYAIKNLEKDLQLEIFVKGTYRPKLTEQGELIYKKAQHLLKMQNELSDYATSLKSGLEASLSLEISPLYPEESLAEVLKSFKNRFPQTKVILSISNSRADLKSLEQDATKIIISTEEAEHCHSDKKLLTNIEELPVSSPEYPAAQEGLTETYFSNLTELKLNQQTCHESNSWSLMSYQQIKTLILQNLGWGYLPASIAVNEIQSGSLVKIPSLNSKQTALYLYHNKARCLGLAAEYLCGLFIKS